MKRHITVLPYSPSREWLSHVRLKIKRRFKISIKSESPIENIFIISGGLVKCQHIQILNYLNISLYRHKADF